MAQVDKDRPSTWRPYNSINCSNCRAHCCSMPVEVRAEDLIRLGLVTKDELENSVKKTAKKLKKAGYISSYREGTDFFMLSQKSNSDCYFLDSQTRLCTVYDRRPDTCRDFPSRIGTRVGYCPVELKK
jgi:Fe-S-cluster containining protein